MNKTSKKGEPKVEMTPAAFRTFCEDHGVSMGERMAYYIYRGESHFTVDKAMVLASCTDVPLSAWLRPENVPNKYMKHLFKNRKAS